MRKPIIWALLTLWVMLAAVPAGAQSTPDVPGGTEVVIGSSIAMNGQFGTEMWGNNSADMDVRSILHGYGTVRMTEDRLALNETVVSDTTTALQGDGSQVYTLKFADGLCYNDGTEITAYDYALYFLLSGAPEIEQIGGTTLGIKHIAGYEAYQAGETDVLSGVRVLPDGRLELRITGQSYPYFYGLAHLDAMPYPISVIAPGCEVADDGHGVYIRNRNPDIEEPIFTAELLKRTLLDPDNGYQSFPKVTSGAYTLISYDGEANEARFVVNERFIGNYEGQKPNINRIVFRHVTEEGMLDDLVEGRVDLLNKVTDGTALGRMQSMAAAHNAQARAQGARGAVVDIVSGSYLRTGFGFLAFACESSPTDSVAVRRAIAKSFDKNAFVHEAMPGTARRAYGYYGLGQWMPHFVDEGEGAEPLNVMERLPDLDVPMDLRGATALLEEAGWKLNAEGQPYAAGDAVRYRENDGALEPLAIRCALTEENEVAAKMRDALMEALPRLGIELEITEMPFPALLGHYYRQSEREYDMFFMASNFSYVFDPYYDFHIGDAYQGVVNASGLRDEELMELGRLMRNTEQDNLREYAEKWLTFQERFVELMPMVPLYSNAYYDFHTDKLHNYNIDSISSWAHAILYAHMSADPA